NDSQEDENSAEIITLETPLWRALKWAGEKATWEHRTRIDVESYMASIIPAIRILKYDQLSLGKITFQHIDNILAQTFKATSKYNHRWKKEVRLTWSNFKKNRAKAYLSSYFGILKEKKILPANPCSG